MAFHDIEQLLANFTNALRDLDKKIDDASITPLPIGSVIIGTPGNDKLYGTSGDDYINGLAGDDWIFGGRRSDVLVGGRGNDTVFGDNGNDRVNGGNGNDHLYGGDGADHLYGDAGNDYLNGGKGGDWLYGGAGNDTFDYNALSDSPGFEETSPVIVRDSIVGFNGDGAALGDRIDLSSIDANLDVDGNQAFTPVQLSYSNGIFSANVIGFGIPGSLDLQIHLVGNPPLDIVGATNDVIL